MDVVLVSFVWEIVWMDAKGEGFKGVKIGLDEILLEFLELSLPFLGKLLWAKVKMLV